jgi:hypothetical protein
VRLASILPPRDQRVRGGLSTDPGVVESIRSSTVANRPMPRSHYDSGSAFVANSLRHDGEWSCLITKGPFLLKEANAQRIQPTAPPRFNNDGFLPENEHGLTSGDESNLQLTTILPPEMIGADAVGSLKSDVIHIVSRSLRGRSLDQPHS